MCNHAASAHIAPAGPCCLCPPADRDHAYTPMPPEPDFEVHTIAALDTELSRAWADLYSAFPARAFTAYIEESP